MPPPLENVICQKFCSKSGGESGRLTCVTEEVSLGYTRRPAPDIWGLAAGDMALEEYSIRASQVLKETLSMRPEAEVATLGFS